MLLYETLSQPLTFFLTFLVGFGCGFITDIRNYISFLCNKNKILNFILDILVSVICCFVFFACVLAFNFGELRFFLILSFVMGIFLQRISIGTIIAKVSKVCYNFFRNLISKVNYGKQKKKKENSNS